MNRYLPKGFKASGIPAGIKKNGERDLGLIVSEKPADAAGVFTRNRIKAAPVLLDMERIQRHTCRAIIANSGNANCCTADQGMRDALSISKRAALALDIPQEEVLVASTGVIGEPLPVDTIQSAVPGLVASLGPNGIDDFAKAIMTTDTVPKVICRTGSFGDRPVRVTGVAKGSGMIRPDMATMLCFVVTDAQIDPSVLAGQLETANQQSFNRITIDGDTSTNDTVLLLANGASGAAIADPESRQRFQRLLDGLLSDLARMIVKDGEGATKLVDVIVQNAGSDQQAQRVADTVAHSSLVKTALFGEDANWGRIIAAIGRSGVPVLPEAIDIRFGDIQMVKNGTGCGKSAEARATEVLKTPEFSIAIDLKMGKGSASVLTCDLSIDYVKINADYRT